MNRFETYAVKARQLVDDADPTVSLVARNVFYNMTVCRASPTGVFNFLYFVQSCVELWLSDRPEVKLLPATQFPFPTESINGTKWPPSNGSSRHCFMNRYIAKVRDDSIEAGNNFDVSYAAKIVALTFNDSGELRSPVSPSVFCAAEEDYWLSGFNSQQ